MKDHDCCHEREPTNSSDFSHSESGVWTCPMHPEIEQDHPGDCPICGMPLEPKTLSAGPDEHAEAEIRDLSHKFWIGAALTLPVLLIAMTKMFPGMGVPAWTGWVEFALATPVVLWAGGMFFRKGWRSVLNRSPNMFTLIAIGGGSRLSLQRDCDSVSRSIPGFVPETRRSRALLRGGGGHHGSRPAGAVARSASTWQDRRSDPVPARTRRQRGTPVDRWRGRGRFHRCDPSRRSATGSSRAKKFRWTEWSSTERVTSTSP